METIARMNCILINQNIVTEKLTISFVHVWKNYNYELGNGTFVIIIFINLHSFSDTITLHEENNSYIYLEHLIKIIFSKQYLYMYMFKWHYTLEVIVGKIYELFSSCNVIVSILSSHNYICIALIRIIANHK
jgi:hypothetical protein